MYNMPCRTVMSCMVAQPATISGSAFYEATPVGIQWASRRNSLRTQVLDSSSQAMVMRISLCTVKPMAVIEVSILMGDEEWSTRPGGTTTAKCGMLDSTLVSGMVATTTSGTMDRTTSPMAEGKIISGTTTPTGE